MKEDLSNIYDVAIVGTGPAGLSAALNFRLHNKNIAWFGSAKLSGKVEKSEKIGNLPGLINISGSDLNKRFKEQMDTMNLEPIDKKVTNIAIAGNKFMILADNDIYEAYSVLLATGAVTGKGFDGEDTMLGRGVSYCATCDGFLYKDKVIAVFCGDKKYEHEVSYLAEMAKQVYFFPGYQDSSINNQNVEFLQSPIKSVEGQMKVEKIGLVNGDYKSVDGFFVLRPSVAPTTLVNGIEMDGAHIKVDKENMTSIKGIYAAGDCTGRPYQITTAMGEGNNAAHAILKFLSEREK